MHSLTLNAAPAPVFLRARSVVFACLAVLMLLAVFARPARAEKDAVEFFNNVEIAQGEQAHDIVVFFGNANVTGDAAGDIVVIFGNVNLRGAAHHDVVNIFGSVHLYDGASVGQDLVNIFGETRMDENTSIGKDTVVIFGRLRAAASATFGGDRVVQPFWLFFIPIMILVLIIRGIVWGVRYPRRYQYMRGY
ncbi:MAG TPA: hypothetical protein VL346_05620 [Acidobacteriaceae bacterium]|nr:hypothetical protein [Acidobacteriaceae bacterium]